MKDLEKFPYDKILIASNNEKKIVEFEQILKDFGIDIVKASEILGDYDIEETGETFEENALLKANSVMEMTNLPCIADDSGISINALYGKPGIYSSRFSKSNGGYPDVFEIVRDMIKQTKNPDDLSAYFTCVIAFAMPDEDTKTFEGICNGNLDFNHTYESGFGYDPIFIPEGHDQTFAQMEKSEKNKISHRGIALEKFIQYFKDEYINER